MITQEFLKALADSLKKCPGGMTRTEVRELMRSYGSEAQDFHQVLLALESSGALTWEEDDGEGEIWVHLSRPEDRQLKRSVPKMEQSKKGEGEKFPQVRLDSEIHQAAKIFAIQSGMSLQELVSVAVKEWMKRESVR